MSDTAIRVTNVVAADSMPGVASCAKAEARNGLPIWIAYVFVISTLIPMMIQVGPMLLTPYRIVLLLSFVPVFIAFLIGKAGRIYSFDLLIIGSTFWAVLSLIANHGLAMVIEPAGILTVEVLGSYMIARTTIRNSDDFRKFVKLFFILSLLILPFAAFESITGRPILLELVPNNVRIVNPPDRWGLRRAQVLHSHPILYGVFMAIGFSLFFFVFRSRIAKVLGPAVSFVGTFFSLSSGALMSIVFQTAFVLWELLTRPNQMRWRIFALLAAAAYVTLDLLSNRTPFHLIVQYATFNSSTAYNRILIWKFGMQNVWANPMFGLGMRDWVRPGWMSSSADNYWLLLTMRHGIPFFIMYVTAILLIVRQVSIKKLFNENDKACRAGYLSSLGGIVLAGCTVHYWHSIEAFILFFIGAGTWAITGGERKENEGVTGEVEEMARVRYSRAAPRNLPSRERHPKYARQ